MTKEVINSELIKHEESRIVELFKKPDGMKEVLTELEKLARDFSVDVTTKKGRDLIASQAYKVSRSKTMLEDVATTITADWKAKAAKVDLEKRKVKKFCDNLRDDIKKPLIEWEKEEARKIEVIKARLSDLTSGMASITSETDPQVIKKAIAGYREVNTTKESWGSFEYDAVRKVQECLGYLEKTLVASEKRIEDQKEMERLKRIEQENEELKRQLRKKEEADKKNQASSNESISKMSKEAQDLIDKKEREKREAERREAKLIQEAKEREERDRIASIEQEKINAQIRLKEKEKEKISKNSEVKRLVHRKMLTHFIAIGISEADAKKIITEIALNKVENLIVNYQDQEIIKEVFNN